MENTESKILHFFLLFIVALIFTKLSFDALILGTIVLFLLQND